jgi:hypothetical protein
MTYNFCFRSDPNLRQEWNGSKNNEFLNYDREGPQSRIMSTDQLFNCTDIPPLTLKCQKDLDLVIRL